MLSTISVKRLIPLTLFQKLNSHDSNFSKLSDDEMLTTVYNWGIDRDNYYYPPGSNLGAMQMSIQMKGYNLRNVDNPTPSQILPVLLDAFEMYHNK
jgi:hypothetical protein